MSEREGREKIYDILELIGLYPQRDELAGGPVKPKAPACSQVAGVDHVADGVAECPGTPARPVGDDDHASQAEQRQDDHYPLLLAQTPNTHPATPVRQHQIGRSWVWVTADPGLGERCNLHVIRLYSTFPAGAASS